MKQFLPTVFALAAALMLAPAAPAAEPADAATVEQALTLASREHKPVLIDFHATWCYSCYYMASHVLTGADWAQLRQKVVFVDADADTPNGHLWMDKLKITFLPSYVVLNGQGQELGRILAEQPRSKFYPQIAAILEHGDTLDGLQRKAAAGSLAALAEVLETYHARDQAAAGLQWLASLPPTVRHVVDQDDRASVAHRRLLLDQAVADKQPAAVISTATDLLTADVGCDRPYIIDNLLEATGSLPANRRKALLQPQQQPLADYVQQQALPLPPACADQRSAVLALADLDAQLDDQSGEQQILGQAIDLTRQRIGGRLAGDRNLADNLRVYLTRAGRHDELDALQRQLIAAYPEDYVYAYRYGISLLRAGKPAQALPYLQQASAKAFGINRLSVASAEVKALQALHRHQEARQVVDKALAANGPWFPEQAAALKASLKS
ncbi:TlpA family protein disulfide reductase [Frateuria aurantia]